MIIARNSSTQKMPNQSTQTLRLLTASADPSLSSWAFTPHTPTENNISDLPNFTISQPAGPQDGSMQRSTGSGALPYMAAPRQAGQEVVLSNKGGGGGEGGQGLWKGNKQDEDSCKIWSVYELGF